MILSVHGRAWASVGTIGLCASAILSLFALLMPVSALSAPCPNESSPGFRSYLPECRAYELVSPEYREGYKVNIAGVSQEGTRLRAESFGSYSEPQNTSGLGQSYRVTRTASGWESSPLDAPFSDLPDYAVQGMSADFQSSIWFANIKGEFSRDVYLDPASGPPVEVGPGAPPGVRIGELQYVGASDDLHHSLFVDPSPSSEEENRLWPGDTTLGERRNSLYEYVGTGNGRPRLVGVQNGSSTLISDCGTALGSLPEGDAYNAVSTDGSTVFFSAAACAGSPAVGELYARIDGERTLALSEPTLPIPGRTCTGTCASAAHQEAVFAGASRDGSRVFFTTTQPLLDGDSDSGSDLYAADIKDGAITALTEVSRGGEGDPTPGSGADVLGVARVVEDGSRVYFVAEGVLSGPNGEGRAPIAGRANLYVASRACAGEEPSCASEDTAFVTTLSGEDAADWSPEDRRPVQSTAPDGRFLVFQSVADLTGDQESHHEAGQVFEYDAAHETLIRVSRGREGLNEDGNSEALAATIPTQNYEVAEPEDRYSGLAVSADGSRVVFSSYDALTPQALQGFDNVYEYSAGQVSLISDGHDFASTEGVPATRLIGTDESGRDVFFTTASPLLPQTADSQVAVYDARSEGGFPPAPAPAPCAADSCQPPPPQPPALSAPVTAAIAPETPLAQPRVTPAGKPAVKPKAKPKPKPKKCGRRHRKHCPTQKRKAGRK